MKQGDIVTVAANGDHGKPRPAVVLQSDLLLETDSVLVAPLTSDVRQAPLFRLTIEPAASHGLNVRSQIMVEKVFAMSRRKCGPVIGSIDDASIRSLSHMVSLVLGLAD